MGSRLQNMKQLPKLTYHLILGILIGLVLAQFVLLEGFALTTEFNPATGLLSVSKMKGSYLLAAIVFLLTVLLFQTKWVKKWNLNRISIYLILVILISIVVAIQGTLFLCMIISKVYLNFETLITNNYFFMVNSVYAIIFSGITLFLLTFVLLVNKKVSYIKFLTKEVAAMKYKGFGNTIEVKGGDELAELCNSINDMSVQLGKQIDSEKELITNMSHDLKTPLTSIVGYLELLTTSSLDEDARTTYTKIAYQKSLRLKDLVNELFDYTKLTNSNFPLDKQCVNVAMLLKQAVGENLLVFLERDIHVDLQTPHSEVYCNIDAPQLLRVFENLIHNAEKYADSGSTFMITLDMKPQHVVISFTNACDSIKEEDVDRLFDRFYRQDKARQKEGSGLGLAISKRIIELHNGEIIARKYNSQITFQITLPKGRP